jgi:hypothetical protein
MQQLLLFSGNSLRNQTWIHEVDAEVASMFESTYLQDYKHWQNGDKNIDLDHELTVLESASESFGADYGVFAKSIGTVFVAKALEASIIKPKFLVLCGLPLGSIERDFPQFAAVIAHADIPVTVINNTDDPVGTASAARDLMRETTRILKDYRFIETPGDTHNYTDYDLIKTELTRFNNV